MRTTRVVLILLVLVMASLISSSASARSLGEILFGSDAKGNQPPYNELDFSLMYRDGFSPLPWPEPMTYHLQERDGSVSAVMPDVTMPVPITNRPIMTVVSGLIMTGQRIGRIYPSADTPIKIVVAPFNGWEDQGTWLLEAIHQARAQVGLECDYAKLRGNERSKAREIQRLEARMRGEDSRTDPGTFPPFICLPAETQPRVNDDGSITFGNPPMALPLMIVAPVSNLIVGSAHSISLLVSINKNSYAGAVIGFKTARPETFQVPNPDIARARSQAAEPPLAREILSVNPPTAAPLVQAGEYANNGVPALVEQFVYGDEHEAFRMTRNQPWDKECLFPAKPFPDNLSQGNIVFFAHRNGRLFDQGVARVWINGELYHPNTPYLPLWSDASRGNLREAIGFIHCPANAHIKIEYLVFGLDCVPGQIVATDEFDAGPAGVITFRPKGY